MKTLVLKLNATGDVVRTTPLLRVLEGPVTWITAQRNVPLIEKIWTGLTALSWEQRHKVEADSFDLVINLEDERDVADFAAGVRCNRVFGACLGGDGGVGYSDDSRGWFDMSLISRFGRARADELKLLNRRSYQDLIFEGLGLGFNGERYILPTPPPSELSGDVAIASASGPVWPMKGWAYYTELRNTLSARGLVVNELPVRATILEHLGDISAHRCVVGGDSLPMHLALGLYKPTVALFNCTSPWEIHGYGLLQKVISPRLDKYFYRRTHDPAATMAVGLDDVLGWVMSVLDQSAT